MVWQALLTCNLVALLAMVGATGLMIDTIRPDQPLTATDTHKKPHR
jgi:hypothetical protein